MTKTLCNSYCVGEDYFEAVSPDTDLINGTISQGAQESPRVDNVDPEIDNPEVTCILNIYYFNLFNIIWSMTYEAYTI